MELPMILPEGCEDPENCRPEKHYGGRASPLTGLSNFFCGPCRNFVKPQNDAAREGPTKFTPLEKRRLAFVKYYQRQKVDH